MRKIKDVYPGEDENNVYISDVEAEYCNGGMSANCETIHIKNHIISADVVAEYYVNCKDFYRGTNAYDEYDEDETIKIIVVTNEVIED